LVFSAIKKVTVAVGEVALTVAALDSRNGPS
jgi:hypothetical protein